MAMLEVRDLQVYYGMIHAIKGISFDVNQGEVIALIGANGAGKTTTLHTITGLLAPKSGSVLFEGKEGLQSAERRRFPHAENRREEAGHKAGFIALAEKTHQQSRAEKNRKQPITTARAHYSLSEQFLFENRRFSQVKSREKHPKNAPTA